MNEELDQSTAEGDAGLRLRMRGEERRISSQHKQLGDLFQLTLASVTVGGPRKAIGDFLLFETALEAHMSLEEDIYFPALHGLRNDLEDELIRLVAEHREIRTALRDVKKCLSTATGDETRSALNEFADLIDRHEAEEEDLLARITEGPVARLGHTILEND